MLKTWLRRWLGIGRLVPEISVDQALENKLRDMVRGSVDTAFRLYTERYIRQLFREALDGHLELARQATAEEVMRVWLTDRPVLTRDEVRAMIDAAHEHVVERFSELLSVAIAGVLTAKQTP